MDLRAIASNARNQWSADESYWHDIDYLITITAMTTNMLMDLRASSNVIIQWPADG